jgi:hypothetical protein
MYAEVCCWTLLGLGDYIFDDSRFARRYTLAISEDIQRNGYCWIEGSKYYGQKAVEEFKKTKALGPVSLLARKMAAYELRNVPKHTRKLRKPKNWSNFHKYQLMKYNSKIDMLKKRKGRALIRYLDKDYRFINKDNPKKYLK